MMLLGWAGVNQWMPTLVGLVIANCAGEIGSTDPFTLLCGCDKLAVYGQNLASP